MPVFQPTSAPGAWFGAAVPASPFEFCAPPWEARPWCTRDFAPRYFGGSEASATEILRGGSRRVCCRFSFFLAGGLDESRALRTAT
jgi:hypothetical protein